MYNLNEEKMFFDIADNQAIVIDSTTGIYYAMNPLGSVTCEYLIKSVAPDTIVKELKKIDECPSDIEEQLQTFIAILLSKEILISGEESTSETVAISRELVKDNFLFEFDEFTDAQDIMMADPVHDVEMEAGWPVMKKDLTNED